MPPRKRGGNAEIRMSAGGKKKKEVLAQHLGRGSGGSGVKVG